MRQGLMALGCALTLAAASTAVAQPLTFWSWRVEDKAFYDEVAKEFEARNPGISVKFTPYRNTEYATILASALAAGSGPDVIHTRAYGALAQLADAGFLLPLDGRLVKGLDDFPVPLLAAARGRKDQRVFGVPFATQTVGVFYNRPLLKKVGADGLPATWGEFVKLLDRAKKTGLIPIANGAKEGPVLEQVFGAVGPAFYGGSALFVDVISGRRDFTDPGFVRALKEVQALSPYFPPGFMGVGYDDQRALFFNEQALLMFGGSWEIGYLRGQNKGLDFGFAPAPPEAPGGPQYVSHFADGNYSVNAKTAHRDAAVKFVTYLATREYGQKFTTQLAQISAVPGVQSADPVLSQVIGYNQKLATPFLMLVGFRYENPTGSKLLQDGLQGLLAGKLTAEQLGAEITKGVATWHKPFQR
jgi:raffinose/stachyose/melibiose transport system substrate-binding protein